jgi:sigma-B regulation protein RsbU (phosphoserine phosphatase)
MQTISGKYQIIRLSAIVIAIFLLGISLKNFLDIAGGTTDENVFSEPFSRVYVTKPIPSHIIRNDTKTTIGFRDTIFPGSLIIRINDAPTPNKKQLVKLLDSIQLDEKVTLLIFNAKGKPDYLKNRDLFVETHEVDRTFLDTNCFKQLYSGALVLSVAEGGVSDRAGLIPGDIITKVNKQPFKNVYGADRILKQSTNKKEIHYEVLRDNELLQYDVKLAKYGVPLQNLLFFVVGILTFFAGFFLIVQRPNLRAARLSGLGLGLLGYTISLVIMRDAIMYNIGWFEYAKTYLLFLSETLWFPILIHSLFYFPIERADLLKKKYLWLIPYVITGIYIALILSSQIFGFKSQILANILNFVSRSFVLVPTFTFYFLFMIFFNRKRISKAESKMYKPLKWAFSIVTIILFSMVGIAMISNKQYLTEVFIISFIIIPFAYYYSIGRYGLLSLEYSFKKNIQYQVSTSMWKILLVFSFILISWVISGIDIDMPNIIFHNGYLEVLDYPLRPELRLFWQSILIVGITVVLFAIFILINREVQKAIDKKYFRSRFDYKKAAMEFNSILAKNLDIGILAKHISLELSDLVHLKRVGVIFFKNEESINIQEYIGFNSDNFKEFCSACANNLCDAIRSFNREFRIDYLPEPAKSIFKKFDFRFVIPIRSKEKILGAILLGEKLSETTFHEEDLAFLNTIASQVSVAVENVYLYQDKALKERIQHELEIARKIQLASLPQTVPDILGLDISGVSVPAMEVGGDFYDFLIDGDDELTVILGDVSGKGTSAAFYMSKAQGIFRTLHEFDLSPRDLLIKANEILYKYIEKNSFISAISAKIFMKNSKILLSRAGHLPLFIYRKKSNSIDRIQPKGMVLGLSKDGLFASSLEEVELTFDSGDVMLFISDGVTEARNKYQQEFNENNLMNIFRNLVDESAESIKNDILDSVNNFSSGTKQFDDISIVVIKVN